MSKQEIKKVGNRAWDVVNLVSCGVGGALLTFATTTPTVVTDFTFGQIVGGILLATVLFRVSHLVFNEQR